MAVKTSSTGAFLIPTAPAVGTTVQGGAANTFTTNAVQLIASTGAAIFITGIHMQLSSTSKPTYVVIRLSTGAADGSIVGEYVVPYAYTAGATGTQMMGYVQVYPWIAVAASTRIGAKSADSVGSLSHTVILQCINQANVVAEGSINETANVIQINTQTASASGTVTFPNATLASTTNITAGTITTVTNLTNAPTSGDLTSTMKTSVTAAVLDADMTGHQTQGTLGQAIGDPVSDSDTIWDLVNTNLDATISSRTKPADTQAAVTLVTTTTNLTNLPAITSNWLTATGIAASALNGKGDWNIGKTGYALSTAGVQAIWDALTSALTTAGSIGKLLVDNINATISSRLASASYTAPDNTSITAIKAQTDKISFDSDNYTLVDLKAIEGALTNGNNATLRLKRFEAVSTNSTPFYIQAMGNYNAAAYFQGGAGGEGVIMQGGSSIPAELSPAASGLILQGGNGGTLSGEEAAPGVLAIGGDGAASTNAAADGIYIIAGVDNGAGGANGINSIGSGSGKSINASQDIAVSDGDLTLASIASTVWANVTRTLTSISDSSGITTLLSRIASALNISGGKVESNVKQINDTNVTGDGSTTPWGPA